MVLSEEQVAEIKEAFQLFAGFDSKDSKDLRVEGKKLGVLLQTLGLHLTDEELQARSKEVVTLGFLGGSVWS